MNFKNENIQAFSSNQFDTNMPYAIIGTGEFTYQPFLIAERLQEQGFDVTYQSTGRSPMYEGCGVIAKKSYYDKDHQANFYLYNIDSKRQQIICYETERQYLNCGLRKSIKCYRYYISLSYF